MNIKLANNENLNIVFGNGYSISAAQPISSTQLATALDLSCSLSNVVLNDTATINIGYNSKVGANKRDSIAVGYATAAAKDATIAIGGRRFTNPSSTSALVDGAIALGHGALASAENAVQIGYSTSANTVMNSLRFRDTCIVSSDGKIPSSSLDVAVALSSDVQLKDRYEYSCEPKYAADGESLVLIEVMVVDDYISIYTDGKSTYCLPLELKEDQDVYTFVDASSGVPPGTPGTWDGGVDVTVTRSAKGYTLGEYDDKPLAGLVATMNELSLKQDKDCLAGQHFSISTLQNMKDAISALITCFGGTCS